MKLFLRKQGSGPRTAALVHGASMSHDIWRDFITALEPYDLTLLLIDQRGHGKSPHDDHYGVQDFARDLEANLPTGLDFLIGQSLGGLAGGWATPVLQPKRFIGIDPAFAVGPGAAFLLRYLGPWQPRMSDGLLRRLGSPPPGSAPDTLARFRESWSHWDSRMMRQLAITGRREPFPIGPPAVPSTLVLADPSFAVPPPVAAQLAAAGWDIRLKPGGVHDLHVQDPQGLVAMLDDVLRETQPAGR